MLKFEGYCQINSSTSENIIRAYDNDYVNLKKEIDL